MIKHRIRGYWFFLLLFLVTTLGYAQSYNYGEVLQKSIFFYEAQQSGKLPDWNRVSWRGDANTNDGKSEGVDLTGGWHDAGDHIKFGFPMAFSVTALNWGYLEYEEAYKQTNQDKIFKNNIRFVTDYFIKCHTGPTEFVAQVSDKSADHSVWAAAELADLLTDRKAYKISASQPGTDVACETAAALASASMLFKDSDPAYSAELIDHAKSLYDFGDQYRGFYTEAIPAGCCYPSGNYYDELVWGALWLYKATGDESYLRKAEEEYDNMITNPSGRPVDFLWSLVWEDKSYGNFVLLSMITGKEKYKRDAEKHLDYWSDDIKYSPGGQAWLFQWGSLRHSSNAALTAFIYADNVDTPKKEKYINFAERQINYILGDNPGKRSYVIGFGNNPPKNPHHRSVHGSWVGSDRGLPNPATHTLYGALVGGPGAADDQHTDETSDYQENEVAVDYNACFQGAVARMQQKYGGDPLPNFPEEVSPTRAEIFANAKLNSSNASSATISMDVSNHSAWPARALQGASVRYYMDISESVEAGYSIADYNVSLSYGEGGASFSGPTSVGGNVYYVEVTWGDDVIIAPAGNTLNAKEAQIQMRVGSGVPFDLSNDWSGSSLTSSAKPITNIPIYDDGKLVGGKEPGGSGPIDSTTYDITATAGTGGSISPSGSVEVNEGSSRKFTITANSGYVVSDVVVNGSSVGSVNEYTFTNIRANARISVSFERSTSNTSYTITAQAEQGGSISPSGSINVDEGENLTISINPDAGYDIQTVLVNGNPIGKVNSYTFTNVKSDQEILARFERRTTTSPGNYPNGSPVAINGKLSITGTQMVNKCGNPIQLRGMSTHGPQWFENCYSTNSLDALVNDWGIDIFRVAMYVGESGYITNPEYWKNWIDNMVEETAKRGIYCMIDWHVLTPGDPNAYLDASRDFWDYMSRKHNGKDHVIYEIANEPNGVEWGTVKSYAEDIIPRIRANDPNTIVIVGTPTWSQDVDIAATNPLNYDNLMYALHFYPGTHTQFLRNKGDKAIDAGLALFVTEFGTSAASGDGGPFLDEAQLWMDWMQERKISWINWSFADKAEVSAALNPGSCGSGSWNNTSTSGTFIKNQILNPADNFVCNATGGGSNQNPVVSFEANPTSGQAPLAVQFDASATTDPDGDLLTYTWDLGNGTILNGATVSYTYTTSGSYSATLTVMDDKGGEASKSVTITATDGNPGGGGGSCDGNYLSVSGNKLYDAQGNVVRLTGINWFGFETSNKAPHGLWSRDCKSMLMQIKDLGFNSVRIPWSNAILAPGASPNGITSIPNPDPYSGRPTNELEGTLSTSLELLDVIIDYCQELNLKVILDNHSREPDGYITEELWYTASVSHEKWISDWIFIADRYKDKDAVVAMDINNEPHGKNGSGSTWGSGKPEDDWRMAAEACGNAILKVNPNVLIMVEGVEEFEGETYWWGGNLKGAAKYPVRLSDPSKLVYSPHEYGPTVFAQTWFTDPSFPSNMPQIWEENFNYLHTQNISPMYAGEFGIRDQGGVDEVWFDEYLAFMVEKGYSWSYWCWNPNSGDTGGILTNDWTSINEWKMAKLRPHLAPEIPNTAGSGADCGTTYTITANANTGGAISPNGAVKVPAGGSRSFTITADTGYAIADVLVNDSSVGAVTTYTFTDIQADATISVLFKEETGGGSNQNPVVSFEANPTSGQAPLAVQFDASATTDPDGDRLTYTWDLGNGTILNGATVSYTYTTSGSYSATLTVMDDKGGEASKSVTITATDGNPGGGGGSCDGNYLSVSGNKLYDAQGNVVRLTGINWFGFETSNKAPHGLWSRDCKSMLMQIKDLGFNSVRIPWSNAILAPGASPNGITSIPNPDPYSGRPTNELEGTLSTSLELLDVIIDYCQELNLKVILDNHSREPDGYITEELWYTASVSHEKWISDWIFIADRYKDKDAVVAMDINNEPHGKNGSGSTWGSGKPEDDWRMAAEACGNAILKVNPNVLIMVEGVEEFEGETYWWGGNLKGAAKYPVRLSDPSKLVYSPHEYGPTVFAQTWFTDPSFPSNMPQIWEENFNYLHTQNISPMYAGEFGIRDQGGVDEVWFDEYLAFMVEKGYSWSYWCWNPNSGDTGGILTNDWTSINEWKMAKLRPHLAPEIPNTAGSGADCGTTYTITANANTGGAISPNGAIKVPAGGSRSFTITADTGYAIADVLVNGSSVGAVTTYTFTDIQADASINVSFEATTVDTYYTISATSGSGGSISPSGDTSIIAGGSQAYTFTPDDGYEISDVVVNGSSEGDIETYTFTDIQSDATISVTFNAVTVDNQNPTAVIDASVTSGTAPLEVTFDASRSSDPDGDTLTFDWDFDNGSNQSGVNVTTVFDSVGEYDVILMVSDGNGGTQQQTVKITVTEDTTGGGGNGSYCEFGTPLNEILPSMVNTYQNVHVLGSEGPDLSNFTNLTINWDSRNKNIYQFSIQTSDGKPNWWSNLMPSITHTLDQTQPALRIQGSGFEGLDDDYYVNYMNNGDLALVSKSRPFSLYFSNSAADPECRTSTFKTNLVYPNPFVDEIHIRSLQAKTIGNPYNSVRLIDAKGNAMRVSVEVQGNETVLKTNTILTNGMYFIELIDEQGTSILKAIKN